MQNRNPNVQRFREKRARKQQARQQQQSTTSSAVQSAEDREDATDASPEETTAPSQGATSPSRTTGRAGRSAAYEASDLRHYGFSQESTHGADQSTNATNGTRRSRNSQGNGSAATNASSRPAPAGSGTTTGGSPAAVDTGSQNNQVPRSSLNAARGNARTQQGPGQSQPTQQGTGQPNGGGENAGPTSSQVRPQKYTREQIEADDPKLQQWSSADERMLETYGDTIHLNDGTHLTGTVDPEEDAMWQEIYGNTIAGNLPLYDLPNGKEGNRFLDYFAQIIEDMAAGKCNSEKMLCFPALMLIKQFDGRNRNARAVKDLLSQRLDLWDEGRYSALLKSVTDVWNRGNGTGSGVRRNENNKDTSVAKKYDAMVKDGKLRNAMRMVEQTSEGGGGGKLYRYDDKDTKSGDPVIDVLRSKFPDTVIPDASHFDPSTSGPPEDTPPIFLTEEDILLRAKRLKSAAGMDGVDGQTARYWITSFGDRSKRLREALARIAMILANGSPHYAMYRALNDARILAADKEPGVRPLACGCIWMRLMAGVVIDSGLKVQARDECGNVQLCAGLGAGIEGNLHAVTRIFPESAGWTEGGGTSNADVVEQLLTQSEETRPDGGGLNDDEGGLDADDIGGSRYEPNTGFGVTLVDADNAFNRLNLYKALDTVARRWPGAARFAFNRYRHYHRTYVRTDPGKPPIIILRKEGVAQGCVLGMLIYGVGLLPLSEELARAFPEIVNLWFADDEANVGSASQNAQCLAFLVEHGPIYGYFPKPEKSLHVCKKEDEEVARREFLSRGLEVNMVRGSRYLGGHVGSKEEKEQYVTSKVEGWCNTVRALARIAETHPQSAHAGFTFCLQHKWMYMCRVVSDIAQLLEPLERVIQEVWIPALFGSQPEELRRAKVSRELIAVAVRNGGLGIRNPMDTAERQHATSTSLTLELVESIVRNEVLDIRAHERQMKSSRKAARYTRDMDEEAYIHQLGQRTPSLRNRLVRASNSGAWLSAIPNNLCDNILSKDEWRDNLRLRYGLVPLNLEPICDGCGKRADVEHYLSCPVGGLRTMRHDQLGRTFATTAKDALSKSYVYREPRIIPSGEQRQVRNANAAGSNSTSPQTQRREDRTRGDVSVYGFWTPGTECVFDVRVTDPSAKSYRKKDPRKVLETQEKEKKDKYLRKCLERRKHFTPLVFSVDGMAGREAKKAMKHLASMLAEKWERPHGQMVHFVKTKMAISLCRSVTLMLRGGRIRGPDRITICSGDAMECLQTGHDEML